MLTWQAAGGNNLKAQVQNVFVSVGTMGFGGNSAFLDVRGPRGGKAADRIAIEGAKGRESVLLLQHSRHFQPGSYCEPD